MIDTIIFDLDGTLLNTLDDLSNSVNYTLSQYKLPQQSKSQIRRFLGNGIRRLVYQSLPTNISESIKEEVLSCFRQYYLEHNMDYTQPYEGILNMLKECKKRKMKLAIVSNKLDPAVKELRKYFFSDYIDTALGETPEIKRKPEPDMVIKAMELLHSEKSSSVYVGDSEVDLSTARNTDIRCISVSWGFRDKSFLAKQGADIIIDSPDELLTKLNELNRTY